MSARLIVGRSIPQAGSLAGELDRRGHVALYQRLLRIAPLEPPPGFAGRVAAAQAIALTSANAAVRLAALSTRRFVPVLSVGAATAGTARRLGFVDVISADGDLPALAALCRQRLDPRAGPVLYVRGRDTAGHLAEDLAGQGFAIDQATVYAAEAATVLRPPVEDALRQSSIDGVLLFSPRSAAIFVSLVRQAGLENACSGMALFAFSDAVADAADLIWRERLTAARPTMADLLDTLQQRYPGARPT